MKSPAEQFGPYQVYEQLGQGGMAVVHRAQKTGIEGFHKVIALKRMLPHMAASEEMVRAFVREARLASFLRHGNVAQTYELGKVDDIYFIAMELVEGRNLREVLRRLAQNGARMPVPIAMNIVNQICDALDYAHNLRDHDGQPLGIIHRDVSPSNIIVSDEGVVKLIDFGIAKASAAGMQTMSGTIKGKFGYMAPEYIAGRIDARADLFAVGVIAHELLTNKPLFTTNDDVRTLQRVREMDIPPPSRINPQVPTEIDEIVMTALERDPDKRWQHATALRSAMTTVTQRLGIAVMSTAVVDWLEKFDFDRRTDPAARKKSRAYIDEFEEDDAASMIVSVEPALGSLPPEELSTSSRERSEYQAALAQYEKQHDSYPVMPQVARTLTPHEPAVPRTVTPASLAHAQFVAQSPEAKTIAPGDLHAPLAPLAAGKSGPMRTLIGVENPLKPISAQMPLVRGSGEHTTPRSGEYATPRSGEYATPSSGAHPAQRSGEYATPRSGELATPRIENSRAAAPTTKPARSGARAIVVVLLLVVLAGGAAAAYFLL